MSDHRDTFAPVDAFAEPRDNRQTYAPVDTATESDPLYKPVKDKARKNDKSAREMCCGMPVEIFRCKVNCAVLTILLLGQITLILTTRTSPGEHREVQWRESYRSQLWVFGAGGLSVATLSAAVLTCLLGLWKKTPQLLFWAAIFSAVLFVGEVAKGIWIVLDKENAWVIEEGSDVKTTFKFPSIDVYFIGFTLVFSMSNVFSCQAYRNLLLREEDLKAQSTIKAVIADP